MAETRENDQTERLIQIKLALDIAGSALVSWWLLDLFYRGKLSYRVNWWLEQYKKRIHDRQVSERQLRIEIGRVIYEAEQVIHG